MIGVAVSRPFSGERYPPRVLGNVTSRRECRARSGVAPAPSDPGGGVAVSLLDERSTRASVAGGGGGEAGAQGVGACRRERSWWGCRCGDGPGERS
jgi:hypothetical protein